MVIRIEGSPDGNHREVFDDANPRVFRDEYRCAGCGLWVDQDEVIWVNPKTGVATWKDGKPYHVDCAPEEEEEMGAKLINPKDDEGHHPK